MCTLGVVTCICKYQLLKLILTTPILIGLLRRNQTPCHRLDISYLHHMAQQYYNNGLAPTTRSTYAAGQQRYTAFCRSISVHPIPATEQILLLFATHLRSYHQHFTCNNKGLPVSYVYANYMLHRDHCNTLINNLHHTFSKPSKKSKRPKQLLTHQDLDSQSLWTLCRISNIYYYTSLSPTPSL